VYPEENTGCKPLFNSLKADDATRAGKNKRSKTDDVSKTDDGCHHVALPHAGRVGTSKKVRLTGRNDDESRQCTRISIGLYYDDYRHTGPVSDCI
jgi:hypothetical protein